LLIVVVTGLLLGWRPMPRSSGRVIGNDHGHRDHAILSWRRRSPFSVWITVVSEPMEGAQRWRHLSNSSRWPDRDSRKICREHAKWCSTNARLEGELPSFPTGRGRPGHWRDYGGCRRSDRSDGF
jgi:hypothetical protein